MQTAKNCTGSSVCTPLSTACSVSLPSPFQAHVEKAGGRHSDIHESFVCAASVSVFRDYLADTFVFAFSLLINSMSTCVNWLLCTTPSPCFFMYYSHAEAGWIVLMMFLYKQTVKKKNSLLSICTLHVAR